MVSIDIKNVLVQSIVGLDATLLSVLDDRAIYSYNSKREFIAEMQKVFESIKTKGINTLIAIPSKCDYCYPTGKAYSFHNPDTDEFIIRYVIHQESENEFRVEECRNIPPRKDGMPF